jgi:hypothetical protein
MLHELIDREKPSCLYCRGEFDIKQDGFFPGGITSLTYEVQMLTCRKCDEVFEIHWVDDAGQLTWSGFVFTCNEVVVFHSYASGFYIGGIELLYQNWVGASAKLENCVPEFKVDFSDKKKLYKKLKTYLVFS